MKGWEDTEERVRPPAPSGGLLKAGLFSCLLHILPLLLLGAGLGTGLTEAGPKVYRIVLHPLSFPENPNQETPSEKRINPRLPKSPPLPKTVPPVPSAVPAETSKMEERELLTAEAKKLEEPVLNREAPKKEEPSVSSPPALSTPTTEEPERERMHQPLVAVAPSPSFEAAPNTKETVNKGLSIAPAGGDGFAAGNSGMRPTSGKGGTGLASASGDGNGYGPGGSGSERSGKGGLPGGEGSGDGRPAWVGNGRQAAAGTEGSGSGNGSGKGPGNGERGNGSVAVGGGGGNTRVSRPSPRDDAKNPRPVYPSEAKEKGYRGQVLLRVEVLSSGLVGQIEIKRSSGHGVLDQSALRAVKQWKFIPAKQEGVPVVVWVNIPFTFDLL